MLKNLLYFILFFLLSYIARGDRQQEDSQDSEENKGKLTILSISQSPSSLQRPVYSSLRGGTLIYIKVSGNSRDSDNVKVFLGNYPCTIPRGGISDSYITCETTDTGSNDDITGLYLTIVSKGKTFTTSSSDYINFYSSTTPQVNQIFPTVGLAGSEVYFYGSYAISDIGDGKQTGDVKKLLIGDDQCKMIDVPQTNYNSVLKCIQSSQLQARNYNISQQITLGNAQKSPSLRRPSLNKGQIFEFTHLPTVTSISQSSGQEGGQKLTIKGTGFSKRKQNNSVSIDGTNCLIQQAENDQITCKVSPRNNSASLKLLSSTANQTGYFSGAGLKYARYAYIYSGLDAFIQSVRAGSPPGTLQEKGFRGDLREYIYGSQYIGEVWNGYFTAPVTGKYTFRGLADFNFAMYLSTIEGSTTLPSKPLIYSYERFTQWTNFYYDDFYTAENSVNLTAGRSYYLEAYRTTQLPGFFKISVDVPNNDTSLPFQAYEVHRLSLTAQLQPEVIVYSFIGGSNSIGSVNLKIVRVDSNGKIYYNVNATVQYGCTASDFEYALSFFDSFRNYMPSVVSKIYDKNGNISTSIVNASRIDYEISLYLWRDPTFQKQNFIVTKNNYNGNFTRTIVANHSPLISGTFSAKIGGLNLNNASIMYDVSAYSLQSYLRTIVGFESVEVESRTKYGCGYSCIWIISYKGVNAPIPNITLSSAKLTGGSSSPILNMTVRRYYSSHITFDPIDYRFLNTYSPSPNVLVTTNSLLAVCTTNCTYKFNQVATIQNWSISSNVLTIGIQNSSKVTLSDVSITVNNLPCVISVDSTLASIKCAIAKNADGSVPLSAGPASVQVLIKSVGIIQPVNGVPQISVPLVVSSASNSSGGMNGGSQNQLFGSGFTTNTSLISIKVCNKSATVKSSSYSQILFYMPSCEQAGNQTITVVIGGKNSTSIIYNYLSPTGPIIQSVSPKEYNPTIKSTLTIVGSGFGNNQSQVEVFLSNQTGKIYQLKIINLSNTTIVVGLSGGLPGNYTVQVTLTNGSGDSRPATLNADLFQYSFTVTSVSPSFGSYYGGTLITINGTNFSPAYSDTLVYIGDTLNWFCNIDSITSTQIKCRTPAISRSYNVNQAEEVVVSTKLYMLNSCPLDNCGFSYLDKTVSPFIANISNKNAAVQTITITGTNFIYNYVSPSNATNNTNTTNTSNNSNQTYKIILYSAVNSSLVFVINPIFANNTYAIFNVTGDIPTGDYSVRIRNFIGESNLINLNIIWNIGSINTTYGSTEGSIVSFSGGSGFPTTLTSSYYITVYNSVNNVYYYKNIISCCSNNIAVISIPPAANGSQILINFVTPSKTINANYYVFSTYTPSLQLLSSAVINPGPTSIIVQSNDTLSVAVTSIVLLSTIDNTNNLTVANWTKSGNRYTFTANLTSGSYKILAFTPYGYCTVNSTISVKLQSGSTITNKPASLAGDTVTITGSYLSPSSYIQINGFTGKIINYTPNAVTYSVPPINSASFQTTRVTTSLPAAIAKISSSQLTVFGDDNQSSSNLLAILDGDKKTSYLSSNSICWIGLDIGSNLAVQLEKIRYFPNIDWSNVVNKLIKAKFQGSNDMSTWTSLGSPDSSAHSGWNTFEVQLNSSFRYIRMRHNSSSQCSLAEMELYGKIFTTVSVTPSSYFAAATYKDGYNSYSFSNALQFREDRTPIVDKITPEFGDIFGGYQITLNGKYLNFGAQIVLIDSIPCAIVNSSSTQISCTVGARPTIPSISTFVVTVNGSNAAIKNIFQYVLKWSDARTWGVDLPPIDGDLVYVPAGMTLLIDQDTPNLLGIASQSATILFPINKNITVTTGFITIVGGSFIAGKESDPLLGNLKIILTGNYYGKQQPTFGNKGIGCLDCKFSMYGKSRTTWTTIASTISPGDTNFTVSSDVDWQVGQSIAVASTSFQHNESEKMTITAVNNRTITVSTPFANQHVSTVQQYGSDQLIIRAEVGLLSRNIQILGDNDTAIGQYGPHVMFTSTKFTNLQVKLAYTQLSQCGQPQIPGRHCIFFNGGKDLPTSYLRGNSIYSSLGKMIAIYGTNYLTVENNVGFRNRGHNIYLQSGTQIKNVLRNNLIISTISANNMMQTDQSPASIWITNPTNDVYGNNLAGSDYYGIFYSTSQKSKQPSDICTFGNPLGLVSNNIIHSNSQYGLRILKLYSRTRPCYPSKDEYQTDDLWIDNPSIASVFHNFTIFKNKNQGVWAQQIGHLMLNYFILAQNKVAGVQFQVANFTKQMLSLNNSLIIGQSQANFNKNSSNYTGMTGVITPRTGQINLTNVRFYNFPLQTTGIKTCSKCDIYNYLTNVGNQIFFKKVRFSSIDGYSLSMLGQKKDIIYDLDGSLSSYFFTLNQSSATLVNKFPHITNFNTNKCRSSNLTSWSSLILCDSSTTIRRIMLTNAIGAKYWYDFYWATMYVLPITDLSTIMNSTNINSSWMTSVDSSFAYIEKPYSWSLPFVTGTMYQVWWSGIPDFKHLSITTTPMYASTDLGVVFKFPYTQNREMYSVGPMRGYSYPTSAQLVNESFSNPDPNNCINGEYRHVNDQGPGRMLAICQSGKNKTKYEYTEINAIYCKYVCPAPPVATLPSSIGTIIKESFVRYWSNASQWPNSTIPAAGQDVYINPNWTVLIDMNPNPAKFMLIDGNLIAEDTRDIFISAQSMHIRAGNISIGNSDSPFTHKFTIQINNTQTSKIWTIDDIVSGNKLLVVTGSLNLYGKAPATTKTYLTKSALAGGTKIFVGSQSEWGVGDSLVLSPSLGSFEESQKVIISSLNTSDGSIQLSSALKFTHYGSSSTLSYTHGTLDVNTQVGHVDRNIKIISGPDTSSPLEFIVYGYTDDKMRWVGSLSLSGVQIEGINSVKYFNVINGTYSSSITQSTFSNSGANFVWIDNSNQISFTNNVFFRSDHGVYIGTAKKLTFSNNLMMGVSGAGCLNLDKDINPQTTVIQIKNNYCAGSAGYGYMFPFIRCTQLQSNALANNTAGSARIGFFFTNIDTSDNCQAFSYIKAYGCKTGQIANPKDTRKLVYQHFFLADNQRGAILRFTDDSGSKQHLAKLSYSYITALSRPSCTQCYGQNKLSCANNIGVQLLSVSTKAQDNYFENYDAITSPEVLNSRADISNVVFDNFKTNYDLPSCKNNFIFRSHRHAYDATATHSLFGCSCSNCDNQSYLLADPNEPSQLGWSGGCGDIVCTGKSNYLIIDWNGTVFGEAGTLIPNNSQIGSNEPLCTFSQRMNAHFCKRTDFAVVGYQSTASDYNTRIMWPVSLFYDGANYNTTINAWRQWDWKLNIPQNHRLGRFVSIIKLNSTYNFTFKSMPPTTMDFQIEKRTLNGDNRNYIIVKVKYPVPNLIRISANSEIVDPILLTDTGLKRQINTSICGDNIYFYTNYTTNFVVTEGECLITMQLVETVQLTTHFAMQPNQFFTNTVMSSFIDNLCALLGVTDTSRVKIVGVYTGSTIVKTMILPPNTNNSTDNSTDNSTSSSIDPATLEPTLAQVQQTLASLIQNGTYSGSMLNATGYQVITSTTALYQVPNLTNDNKSTSSISITTLVGVIVGSAVGIIILVIFIIHRVRKNPVNEDLDESAQQQKEIDPSGSIVFSKQAIEFQNDELPGREQKNRLNRVTNNMRRNRRLARNNQRNNVNNNSNIQVRENNKDYFDFEE